MEWVNLHMSMLRSPEYIGSEPVSRATWLNVLAYCCEQENGGLLAGAGDWKDRQWQQACGVTLREVKNADKLLHFQGKDLHVAGYPKNKEKHVKQARRTALLGAMARWGNSDAERHSERRAEKMPNGIANGNAEQEQEQEQEQEGKEKGEKESPPEDLALCAESPQAASAPAPRKKSRKVMTDGEWLANLKADPTYAGIDVAREHGKMLQWCSLKGQPPTRLRFLNWLNRADRALAAKPTLAGLANRERIPPAKEGEW